MLNDLAPYLEVDRQKRQLVDDMLRPKLSKIRRYYKESDLFDLDNDECRIIPITKYCPECHKKFNDEVNFCYDCAVKLKNLDDIIPIREIKSNPVFTFMGKREFSSFEDIFAHENMEMVNSFNFSKWKYGNIVREIKKSAFKNFDELVKANELVIDYLDITDNVLLFAKSFVPVTYKSYGQELGLFVFNEIEIDDRQTKGLQITTLLHELSHFLLKEILAHVLCKVLDCSKNSYIEAIVTFILTYSPFTRLIDEYCAHTVEGRFTVYGYQDYSSFIEIERSLEGEMSRDEIEITKSIGNTFAKSIKNILEGYLDSDLRQDIKDQFMMDVRDVPNYEMLRLENCNNLTYDGFIKAIWLILSDGFVNASLNVEKLAEYEACFR